MSRSWTWVRTVVPGAVLALALARIALGDPFTGWDESEPEQAPENPGAADARSSAPPPVSPHAQRILGGLAIGDDVAGLEVERVEGPHDGELVIELRDGARGARVWITRRGARDYAAARQALRFDLFYGLPRPGLERVSDETSMRVLEELGRRIEAAGADPEHAGL